MPKPAEPSIDGVWVIIGGLLVAPHFFLVQQNNNNIYRLVYIFYHYCYLLKNCNIWLIGNFLGK